MALINITKKTTITKDLKVVASFLDKLFGLLNPNNPRSLLFQTRFGIHTFGLNHNIDVLVLDNKNQIKKTKKCLKPNHFFFWNPKYKIVIELPSGAIIKSKTQAGDLVKFGIMSPG